MAVGSDTVSPAPVVSTGAGGAPWRIVCDQLVTRRKLYQIITDPEGRRVFYARRLSDCFQWLLDNEIPMVELDLLGLKPVLCAVPGEARKEP